MCGVIAMQLLRDEVGGKPSAVRKVAIEQGVEDKARRAYLRWMQVAGT